MRASKDMPHRLDAHDVLHPDAQTRARARAAIRGGIVVHPQLLKIPRHTDYYRVLEVCACCC